MTDPAESAMPTPQPLTGRLRAHLQRIAVRGEPVTYRAVAGALALQPPHTIHQVTQALEGLMREDAANGHPFIAALVISRTGGGLPAPGFFDLARELGRFDGDLSGPDAAAAHAVMVAETVAFWGAAGTPEAGTAA